MKIYVIMKSINVSKMIHIDWYYKDKVKKSRKNSKYGYIDEDDEIINSNYVDNRKRAITQRFSQIT